MISMKVITPSRYGIDTCGLAVREHQALKPCARTIKDVNKAYVLSISEWRREVWQIRIQTQPKTEATAPLRGPDSATTLHPRHQPANGSQPRTPALSGQMAPTASEPEGVVVG